MLIDSTPSISTSTETGTTAPFSAMSGPVTVTSLLSAGAPPPVPKPPAQRQRRNKVTTAASLALAACGGGGAPGGTATVETPTRVLWGDGDQIFPFAWSDKLKDFFPNSDLRKVEGAGHFVMREAPDRVNSEIIEWFG